MKKTEKEFFVWIGQVNASRLVVSAKNKEQAMEKAYRKWRKELAHAEIRDVRDAK